jgi:hypothetical protein
MVIISYIVVPFSVAARGKLKPGFGSTCRPEPCWCRDGWRIPRLEPVAHQTDGAASPRSPPPVVFIGKEIVARGFGTVVEGDVDVSALDASREQGAQGARRSCSG